MNFLQFGSFQKQIIKALNNKNNNNLKLQVYIDYEGWVDEDFVDLTNEEQLRRVYESMKIFNKKGDKYRLINIICEF